jgi:hypothetical protein
MLTGFIWLRVTTSGRSGKRGMESSGAIIGREIVYQLRNYKLLKKDSSPWTLLSIDFHH